MRTRTTLILLAANLVLFGVILYLHYQGHPDRLAREQSNKVFTSEVAVLDFLEIRLPGEEPRVLQKQPEIDRWNIRSPVQWPANIFAVNRILQQLKFLERVTSFRTVDLERSGQTLADYGLEDPSVVLIFGRGSKRHEIRVGKATDIGDRLYILDPTGDWVHVVDQSFAQTLSLSLDQLQSDAVFEIPLFEVRSLNLQLGTHSKIRLAREESNWVFETPFRTNADRTSVEATINRLNGLQIRQFIRNENSDFGLGNPAMRITLDGNAKRETLLVGSPVASNNSQSEARVYAKLADNPTIFTLPAEPLHALENAQTLLRDRKLLTFERHRISSIKVSHPGVADVVLQKLENDKWQIVSRFPDQSVRILPAGTEQVEGLLQTLDEVYVLKFENDAPSDGDLARYGFNQPQRIVTLSGDGEIELLLGAHVPDAGGSTVFAKLSNSRFVYTVDTSLLRDAPARTDYYRDRLLLPQPDGAIITSVRMRERETGQIVFEAALPSPETDWETAVSELPETVSAAILQLLPELRNLRVDRYLRDEFSQPAQIDGRRVEFPYVLEAELLLAGGETPRQTTLELFLSDRLGGRTLIAGSADLNVLFSVRQEMIDALAPLLFDRPMPTEEVSLSTDS